MGFKSVLGEGPESFIQPL